jgi:hypothetical protein
MIEKILLDYLQTSLPDIPCYMERPEKKPRGKYILLEKTGSGLSNHLDRATMAVQSYAPSLEEAGTLNVAVKKLMLEADTVESISGVRLQTDYNFTDPTTKQPRYQAVFDFYYYEEE